MQKKNRKAKAALEREVKREREIAEREQENENSAGWLPEMSFQTVLSIVGIAFTAFELYQRFRKKENSGGGINAEHNSVQSPISQITAEAKPEPSSEPRAEPNNRGAERNETQSGAERRRAGRRLAERSPKFGMV